MSVFDKIKERMYKCRKSRRLDDNEMERKERTSGFLNLRSPLIASPANLIKDDVKIRPSDLKPLAVKSTDLKIKQGEVSSAAQKKADEAKKKAEELMDKGKKKADEEAKKKKDEMASAAKKKADEEAKKKKDELAAAAKKKADDAQKKKEEIAAAAKKKADEALKKKEEMAAAAKKKADEEAKKKKDEPGSKKKAGDSRSSAVKKADEANKKQSKKKADNTKTKGSPTPKQTADDSCSRPPHSYTIPYLANPAPDFGRFQDSKESLDSVTSPETNMRIGPFRQFNGGLPPYSYIGREAKKLLNKYWNYAPWHIDCLTKCFDWLDIFSYGDGERRLKTVTGGVGLRESYNIFEFSQNWQTDAWVGTAGLNVDTGLAILSSLLQVAYVTSDNSGFQASVDAGLELFPIKLEVIVPIKMPIPKITGYLVVYPATNFLLGYRTSYDMDGNTFDKHSLGACYRTEETELAMKVKNFENISGSIFQRLGEFWAIAFKGKLFGEGTEQFSVGVQYHIYDELLLKARICDTGLLGLAFRHRVTNGIKALYHCSFNVNSPSFKNCRFGVGWSVYG